MSISVSGRRCSPTSSRVVVEHLALILLRVPFFDVESTYLVESLVGLLVFCYPIELLHIVVQEANTTDLFREAGVDDIILNTRCDPAERPIPFKQEVSQHVRSAFARVTSVEPEVHERAEIVYCFSSYLVFAVVVNQPEDLQTVNSSLVVPLMVIPEPR